MKSEFMMIVPIYAKVSFDTTKNKPVLGLVAKIDGKAIGFSYATIGEYFIGENDKIVTIIVLSVKSEIRHSLMGGKVALKLFKAVKQIAKKEKVKRMLTHVTSGANISLTDRFFRKIGVKTLGGNYAFKL